MSIQKYIQNNIINKTAPLPFPTYKKEYKKGETITAFGQIERKGYFIIKGITESNILKDGETKIIDFVFPGSFICSYTSFLLGTPSEIQTLAITDCVVEYFLKEDLEKAYQSSILANQFGRHVTNQFFISKLKRENDFLTKSAEERYIDLINKRPEILQHVPIHKIAKYLGIHPESLSRIRKKVIS